MRSRPPALFPVFRSAAQAQILAATLLYPDREQTITDLSRRLDIPLATVSDEASRLTAAELLTSRKVGRSNLLRANASNRLVRPLTEIVLGTMGPHLLVHDAFSKIPGILRLIIYGSWAARYHGTAGPPPNDLDILVVGTPDRAEVYQAADSVEQQAGVPVSPVIASSARWHDHADPLMAQIKASPSLEIDVAGGDPR